MAAAISALTRLWDGVRLGQRHARNDIVSDSQLRPLEVP